tara:strand:+ start:335 stop:502 length:168 start_codon:yes stop_codon:yes gene_type:complete
MPNSKLLEKELPCNNDDSDIPDRRPHFLSEAWLCCLEFQSSLNTQQEIREQEVLI